MNSRTRLLLLLLLLPLQVAFAYTVTRQIAVDVTSPDRDFALTLNRGGTEYVEALLYQNGVAMNPTSAYTGGYLFYSETAWTNVGVLVPLESFTTNALRFWFSANNCLGIVASNEWTSVTYHAVIVLTGAVERTAWDQGTLTVRPQIGVSGTATTTNLGYVETDPIWRGASNAVWSAIGSGVGGTSDHSALTNLSYAASGHTGFQPAGNYATGTPLYVESDTAALAAVGMASQALNTAVGLASGAAITAQATAVAASNLAASALAAGVVSSNYFQQQLALKADLSQVFRTGYTNDAELLLSGDRGVTFDPTGGGRIYEAAGFLVITGAAGVINHISEPYLTGVHGATNIVRGTQDVYEVATRTLTYSTNGLGGGGGVSSNIYTRTALSHDATLNLSPSNGAWQEIVVTSACTVVFHGLGSNLSGEYVCMIRNPNLRTITWPTAAVWWAEGAAYSETTNSLWSSIGVLTENLDGTNAHRIGRVSGWVQ